MPVIIFFLKNSNNSFFCVSACDFSLKNPETVEIGRECIPTK